MPCLLVFQHICLATEGKSGLDGSLVWFFCCNGSPGYGDYLWGPSKNRNQLRAWFYDNWYGEEAESASCRSGSPCETLVSATNPPCTLMLCLSLPPPPAMWEVKFPHSPSLQCCKDCNKNRYTLNIWKCCWKAYHHHSHPLSSTPKLNLKHSAFFSSLAGKNEWKEAGKSCGQPQPRGRQLIP